MKSRMKRFFVSFFVVVLCVVSLTTPAYALIWNGSSSAGGGGGSTSSGYAVNTDGTSLVGFRFSLVDSDDFQWGNSVDVFTGASMDAYDELSTARKFNEKKSKAYWTNHYSSVTTLDTSTGNAGCYVQSDMAFEDDLPVITGLADINNNVLANRLDIWQQAVGNINALLDKIAYTEVQYATQMGGYSIIVEPILQVRLAGVRHVVTVTELALHGGGYVFNGNWDSNGGSSGNTGSWGFISEYTNKYFPMYMTTNGAECNWGAPTTLTKRATFRDIITKGYGVSVMTGERANTLTVVYHSNGADRLQYSMNPITEDDLVNKYKHVFRATDKYWYGLWDVDDPFELYLSKDNEITTGYWLVGSSNSSKKISQTFTGTGQELAEALGTTLEDGSKTVHVYAEWEPQPNVAQYTVRHHLEGIDGLFRVEDAEILRADTGTSIKLAGFVKTYEGFSYSHARANDVDATTAIVRGDGSLVIDLFYTRNKYTVTLHKGTGISATTGAGTYYYGEEVVIEAFLLPYYSWYQWTGTINTNTQRYTFSMPARNVTMTAHTNNNISFQVNHHLMNLDGSTYTLKETETLYAYDGTTVPLTGLVNTYRGFTYKEGKVDGVVVETTTVRRNVSLVIDLYYSRNKYTVTLEKGEGISSTTGAGTYFYDEEVTINATVSTGYVWGAWDGYFLTTTKKYTFKMPAEDVTLTANAVPGGEDAPPFINAVDRWFSLDEAQAGGITLDELMKTAEAVDSTVGDVTDFSVEGVFTILGYNEDNKDALADEFKRFTASGSATVTYYAEDKAGNTAYCTVTVHIVAWDQQHVPVANTFVRFIDVDYFGGIANQYVAEEDGGLHKDSIWIKNDAYRMKLIETLYNLQNESTKKWHTVYQTWTFTKEQVAEAKQYVEEHGLGKVKRDDALMGFFNRFKVR